MVQTFARAVELLRMVSLGPTTFTQAARALEVNKSIALRLLQTLDEDGFVRLGPGGS